MNESSISRLKSEGLDVDGALERFMNNTAMYEKFLKKFANDPNYDTLKSAIADNECEKAFSAAHTLKGVSSNLSLTPLFNVVSEQTELLRAGDLGGAAEMMPQVDEEYHRMLALIDGIE